MRKLSRRGLLRSATSPSRRLSMATQPALVEALEGRVLLSVVTSAADGVGTGKLLTLRQAIAQANAGNTATTITFDPTVFATAQTITLNPTLGALDIDGNITITGPTGVGQGVTVNGGNASQVFIVGAGAGNAAIANLTIEYGGSAAAVNGGGVANAGYLTLSNDTIYANNLTVPGSNGGGVSNDGTLIMYNDTVAFNNVIGNGGGIYNSALGNATLINVTIGNNTATGSGTGIDNEGEFAIGNTIVAGDTNPSNTGAPDVVGAYNAQGDTNLIGLTDSTSSGFPTSTPTAPITLIGVNGRRVNPDLDPLGNYGGPTETMQPRIGSPVVAAGDVTLDTGITTDQRGPKYPRIINNTVDIGAVELNGNVATVTITVNPPGNQTAVTNVGESFSLGNFSVTEAAPTGPFSANINWGDGSKHTIIGNITVPGTIPDMYHTYTTGGNETVTITVTDSGNNSGNATFTVAVAAASILGQVLCDTNGNGTAPTGNQTGNLNPKPGLPNVLVYLDLNNDGNLDAGDPTCQTDPNGYFGFANLGPGNYTVGEVVPGNYVLTTSPTTGNFTVQVVAGQTAGNISNVGPFLDAPVSGAAEQAVFRLYSPVTLEHLFTSDLNEYTTLGADGWTQEGVAYDDYTGPATVNGITDEPLYRLYNTSIHQHLWTSNPNEYVMLGAAGWTQEGIVGYVFPSAVTATAPNPLYRLSNTTLALHLWTASQNEYNTLATQGWTAEGIIGYVSAAVSYVAAPTGLTATADGPNIDLAWTNPNTNANGFQILRSTDGITFDLLTTLTSSASTTWTDTTAAPGQTYYYEVRADNAFAISTASNVASASTNAGEQAVYRLYSPATMEHLFTSDPNEYTALGNEGWNQEGIAFDDYNGPATVNGITDEPLYRLYNTTSRRHLWTSDFNEYTTLAIEGWNQEGIAGYVFPSAVASVAPDPLYRLSLPTTALHVWTSDPTEDSALIAGGWTQEGIIGYVAAAS